MKIHQTFTDRQINFPFFLAPMVGLSHIGLRLLIKDYMPADAQTIWATEMLSSRRLPSQKLGYTPETFRLDHENDLAPQILGNEERFIAQSLQRLQEWGIKAIDINMGCPVKKALKHNYGVALMGDKAYAKQVVAMTVKHSSVPVSVKLRAGLQGDGKFLLNFVDGLQQAGASWVCLHPRMAAQKRRGKADWSQIKLLKQHSSMPIIGNGDIQTVADAFAMLDQTDCDGVMIGRALTARPWLMWQIGEKLGFKPPKGREGQLAPNTPEQEAQEFGRSLIRFAEICAEFFEPNQSMRKIKFLIRNNYGWLNFGHRLTGISSKAKNPAEFSEMVSEFFSKDGLKFSDHTDLRY